MRALSFAAALVLMSGLTPHPHRWSKVIVLLSNYRGKRGGAMRWNQESLGTIRGIVMAVVAMLILLAFIASRLHLRGL